MIEVRLLTLVYYIWVKRKQSVWMAMGARRLARAVGPKTRDINKQKSLRLTLLTMVRYGRAKPCGKKPKERERGKKGG